MINRKFLFVSLFFLLVPGFVIASSVRVKVPVELRGVESRLHDLASRVGRGLTIGSPLDTLDDGSQLFEHQGADEVAETNPKRLIVKFKENSEKKASVLTRFNLRERNVLDSKLRVVVDAPELVSQEALIASLNALPEVEYAETDAVLKASYIPNDPYYSPYQWNFPHVGSEAAWDVSRGVGVTVAVVDTGVAYENYGSKYKIAPDLAGTSFVQGFDFVGSYDRNRDGDYNDRGDKKDTHANDENGHGTHVAGTIAQKTNNAYGTAGLAFESSIMPVRVLNAYGDGYTSWVASGIRFAADNGVRVINLSLGGPDSQTLKDAVDYAIVEKGVIVVAASGNENTSTVSYPAAYPGVISVGAVGYDNVRAPYSNYGTGLTLVAPGGNLDQDLNGDGYGDGILQQTLVPLWSGAGNTKKFDFYFYEGTSMATPHVAAAAAILLSSGVASSDVDDRLTSTATDLGEPGYDPEYGWGALNLAGALGL